MAVRKIAWILRGLLVLALLTLLVFAVSIVVYYRSGGH
jgi:hypothetical protein